MRRLDRDPTRPVYVISVAASIVSVHPRTLRIYEDEGLLCPARTATNIRLYSEEDVRRILWIRHLTQNRGVNLAGIRILFELEERLGARILETLFDEANAFDEAHPETAAGATDATGSTAGPHAQAQGPATGPIAPPGSSQRAGIATHVNEAGRTNPTRQAVNADHH
jgi:MerR family transcriptional regulator/heat shock protein HspR